MRISKYDLVFLASIIAVAGAFFINTPSPVFAQNPGPVFQTTNNAYVGSACGSNIAYLFGPAGRLLTCQSGTMNDLSSARTAPTSTDPGCTATSDIGKFWIDNTSSTTTHFKVCVAVDSSPEWASVI